MKYFVYVHRKKSNGQIFYVGKGCRYRHKSQTGRTPHWYSIVKKHGYIAEIIQNGLSEEQAFKLEKELIALYKEQGLCNLTDGGEGTSGLVVSEKTKSLLKKIRSKKEYRDNLSKKAKERYLDPEFKRKFTEARRLIMAREDVKEKIRIATIKQFSNPEARELARQNTLKQFSNPLAVENSRQKALQRFNTPEKRAKHAQAKEVICLDNKMIFGTTTLAAEWLSTFLGKKADNSNIARACRNGILKAYGFSWGYTNQPR